MNPIKALADQIERHAIGCRKHAPTAFETCVHDCIQLRPPDPQLNGNAFDIAGIELELMRDIGQVDFLEDAYASFR